jgi:hypothetical protein
MSKRSMLKLFEENGRGRAVKLAALPGQLHSQPGCLLPWTIQQPPCVETRSEGLVKLTGGPLPDPLGHPAASAQAGAQKHGTPPAAGKQAGTQTCRLVGA